MTGLDVLLVTTASIAFVHAILGPDHYLPFVVMARARRWSLPKTLAITTACGAGHVLTSIALGLAGAALGFGIARFEAIESMRGMLAAWALIAFGLVYMVWGLRRAARGGVHSHPHAHADGRVHAHPHDHSAEHLHPHGDARSLTPWVLFTVFLLGPCEPLIPLLMLPAVEGAWATVWIVTAVFSVVTLVTMAGAVLVLARGATRIPLGSLERYSHAIAGATILLCGVAIEFLGL